MNTQDKQHLESLIHSARIVVRETGWLAQKAEDTLASYPAELHPQINHAYDMACAHLTQLDPVGALKFIKNTYGPSFRQAGDTQQLANMPDSIYGRQGGR